MKKIISLALIILIGLAFIFFVFCYKNKKTGNTIIDTDILNISSYEATVEIEVHSNKNVNKYIMEQKYEKANVFYEKVVEPENFAGLTIKGEEKNVTLENPKIELKSLYENFAGDMSNLNLMSFIDNYKTEIEKEEQKTENEIIKKTRIKNSQNKYQMYQKLYINRNTNLPTKMEILDINQNISIYILYKEIKLNYN